jgi:Zn-dependent peptidase ImmA (M78 family)
MRHDQNQLITKPSALVRLRELLPDGYEVSYPELLNILERQAERLLFLGGYDPKRCLAVDSNIVRLFPRLQIVGTDRIKTSGASVWNGHEWLVFVNSHESKTRQRFTLFHELAHVIQHGRTKELFTGRDWLPEPLRRQDAFRQCERAADYFAASVLMPQSAVKLLLQRGVLSSELMASCLNVSPEAMRIRLEQLGLVAKAWMCRRGQQFYSDSEDQLPNIHYLTQTKGA